MLIPNFVCLRSIFSASLVILASLHHSQLFAKHEEVGAFRESGCEGYFLPPKFLSSQQVRTILNDINDPHSSGGEALYNSQFMAESSQYKALVFTKFPYDSLLYFLNYIVSEKNITDRYPVAVTHMSAEEEDTYQCYVMDHDERTHLDALNENTLLDRSMQFHYRFYTEGHLVEPFLSIVLIPNHNPFLDLPLLPLEKYIQLKTTKMVRYNEDEIKDANGRLIQPF